MLKEPTFDCVFHMLLFSCCQTSRQYHERVGLPPHIFGLAEQAYNGLLVEQRSQCCIISGESGAGKTESSKYFVQHLLGVAQSEESNLNVRIQQVR